MKKLISLCCAVLLLLSLCACGASGPDTANLKNRYFPSEITIGSQKADVLAALTQAGKTYTQSDVNDMVYVGNYDLTIWFKDGKVNAMRANCQKIVIDELTGLLGEGKITDNGKHYAWSANLDGSSVSLVVAWYDSANTWRIEWDD